MPFFFFSFMEVISYGKPTDMEVNVQCLPKSLDLRNL